MTGMELETVVVLYYSQLTCYVQIVVYDGFGGICVT